MNAIVRFSQADSQIAFNELQRNEVFNATPASRRPRKGDPTSISVSVLPVIKNEVKRKVSRRELCSIHDFNLETYIVELALLHYNYFKNSTTEELIQGILTHIRKEKQFWIEESEVYQIVKDQGIFEPGEEDAPVGNDENMEMDRSLPYQDLRNAIEEEIRESVMAPNRYMRIPRLPLILFPMLFQFAKRNATKSKEGMEEISDLYLQNLIMAALLRGKHHYRIEQTTREQMSDLKNEKFRRSAKIKGEIPKKPTDFVQIQSLKSPFAEEMYDLLIEFRDFCEDKGFNLYAIFNRYTEMRSREEELLGHALYFITTGYTNYITAQSSPLKRFCQMTPLQLDPGSAYFHYDLNNPPTYDDSLPANPSSMEFIHRFIYNRTAQPGYMEQRMPFKGENGLDKVAERYFTIHNSEVQRKRRSYRYFSEDRPKWTSGEYEKFLQGVQKFNNESLANKKIAKFMGKHIDPNHVRYERQLYNKKMKNGKSNDN